MEKKTWIITDHGKARITPIMISTALYAASTGPVPIEHAIFSSPSEAISLTVAVERPSVPPVTCPLTLISLQVAK